MSSWGAFWSAHLQYLSAVVLLSGTMERKKNENLMRKGTLSGRCSQHAISNKLVRNTNTETSTPKTQILRSHSRPTESEILGTGPQINALTSLPGVSMYTQVWEPLSKEKKAQWITGSLALRQSAYHCLFPYSPYSQFSEDKRGHPNNLDSSYQQNKSLYTSSFFTFKIRNLGSSEIPLSSKFLKWQAEAGEYSD